MARGLMAVLALTAAVAHAQDNSEIARSPGAMAPPGEGKGLLASRSPSQGRDVGTGTPDGGVDGRVAVKESTLGLAGDCSVVETYLTGRAPVVRNYDAPPAARRGGAWEQAPYAQSVTRCGRVFVLQIHSRSADSWVLDHARVEGPRGETLQVVEPPRPNFRQQGDGWEINVIVGEASPEAKFSMLRLHMVGRDGRVAQATVENLP